MCADSYKIISVRTSQIHRIDIITIINVAIMKLGHLLTLSRFTHSEVSSRIFLGSFCLLIDKCFLQNYKVRGKMQTLHFKVQSTVV